jgi:hypothetical protein
MGALVDVLATGTYRRMTKRKVFSYVGWGRLGRRGTKHEKRELVERALAQIAVSCVASIGWWQQAMLGMIKTRRKPELPCEKRGIKRV